MKLQQVGDKLRVIADEPYISIADQIKAAVLAERERCAKIMEAVAKRLVSVHADDEVLAGVIAIRKGETP